MQKLKNFAVVTLALMLIVTLAVSVSAEPVSGKSGSKTIDVNAKYTSGALTPKVYSVDVTWGKMEFTYSVSGTREWNPETHEYADKTSAGWKAEGNDVTVVNHSNTDVTVHFTYAAAEGYSGVTGAFSVGSDTLDAGVEGNAADADRVSTVAEFTKVGSITVSLSQRIFIPERNEGK